MPGVGREGALGSGVRLEPGRARTGADAAGRLAHRCRRRLLGGGGGGRGGGWGWGVGGKGLKGPLEAVLEESRGALE